MSLRLTSALVIFAAVLVSALAIFRDDATAVVAVLLAFALGALALRLLDAGGEGSRSISLPAVRGLEAGAHDERAAVHSRAVPSRAAAASREPSVSSSVVAGEAPARALLEATMESMREGVLVVDGSMRVVAANNSARSLLRGEFALASSPRRLTDLTRNPAIHSAFTSALERGERAESKIEIVDDDGERVSFDLHVAPLRSSAAAGSRTAESDGAVGVFFDITRLERLERVRQEFLSNVSHELRTPLTAILTFVETLEDGGLEDPDDGRHFLSVIRRNAERMRNLINDILELSAIEAGTVAVRAEPVGLSSLVDECFMALAGRASERGVELRNEVAREVRVFADARRLEQMLMNLTDNAIKFNSEGGSVRVAHERTRGRDRISVADTGEGIAPEHLPRIFERFYRIDRARSRALGGTGLGLAIVKHLARAHGGEAHVRSVPGRGSTFTIELPAGPTA